MNNKIVYKIISGTLLCSMIGYTVPVFAYTKDETVYSKLDTSGNNYKTIVSTHIKNTKNEDLINDISDLLNIKNTSGDETYTQNGNNFTWNSNKNDIYYQGETQKELPIQCNVKYELNGEEISAEEIIGKSGRVKITLQYINKEERIVNINGKPTKMYVPFVVVGGTIIENENNKNIEISNGKVIDDGTKSIIVGMAMPGLQESLGISNNDIDIPSNIEITMDTTNFKFNSIISYVTPKVLEEKDLDVFDKLDEIYNKVNTLQSSSVQILDGANSLKDGTQRLANGTTQIKEGTVSAYNGASQISNQVDKAIKNLTSDKNNALDEKTLKGIETKAAEASILTKEQERLIIKEADKGIEAQAKTIKEQYIANAKQIAETTAIKTAISVAQTTAKQTAIDTAKTLNPNLDEATLEKIGNNAASKATLTDVQKKQVIAQADSGIEAQRASIEANGIASAKQIAEQTALKAAQNGATTAAKVTATTVAEEVANQVKSTASKQVASQMKTLGEGLNQLTNGLSTLNTGAQSLETGAIELEEGATTLAQGIETFNEEGIKKICNYISGNTRNLTTKLQKLTELSKEYNNFTMLDKENEGNVKFIMIIDSIKKQQESEQNKEEAIINK